METVREFPSGTVVMMLSTSAGVESSVPGWEVTACHVMQPKKKKKRKISTQIYQDLSFRGHRKKVWGAMRELIKHNKKP